MTLPGFAIALAILLVGAPQAKSQQRAWTDFHSWESSSEAQTQAGAVNWTDHYRFGLKILEAFPDSSQKKAYVHYFRRLEVVAIEYDKYNLSATEFADSQKRAKGELVDNFQKFENSRLEDAAQTKRNREGRTDLSQRDHAVIRCQSTNAERRKVFSDRSQSERWEDAACEDNPEYRGGHRGRR